MTARATLLGSNQDCNFVVDGANDDDRRRAQDRQSRFQRNGIGSAGCRGRPHRRRGAVAAHRRAAAQRGGRKVHGDNGTAGQAPPTCGCCGILPGGTLYRVRLPAAGRRRGAGRGGGTRQPRAGRIRPPRPRPRPAVGPAVRRRRCGGTDFACRRPVAAGAGRGVRGSSVVADRPAGRRASPAGDAPRPDRRQRRRFARCGRGRTPDGVIDFGDLSHSWAVSELAITVSSVLGHPGTDPTSILPGVRAFHAIRPLIADGGARRCGRCWCCAPRC